MTQPPPEPEKKFLGVPYNFEKPTAARYKNRMWNSRDRRIFPPKAYGFGWTINFYWFAHPVEYVRKSD